MSGSRAAVVPQRLSKANFATAMVTALCLVPAALLWVWMVTKREACRNDGKSLRMKRLS